MRRSPRHAAVAVASGVALMVVLGGCGQVEEVDDPVVAVAFGEFLHWSELRQVVPVEAEGADSTAMAQRYINNWLREHALLHQAEQNLAGEQKDFDDQLQEYRKELLIYAYEEALVRQKLDTAVTEQEILDHYSANSPDLELKSGILRVRWSKVKEDDRRTLERLKGNFLSGDVERMREFEVWLAERGIPIMDRSTQWVGIEELREQVPLPPEQLSTTPAGGGRLFIKDGYDAFFVDILEHRPQGGPSPLELVRNDIRSIIINQRKLRFVERMREDIYREALERQDIRIL
ncbi:MAG: hypothetical protein R2815_00635 [Flavobacteriales bacterium]